MEVVITPTARDCARVVVDEISRLLSTSTVPVLGLATGSSPLVVYEELILRCEAEEISFLSAQAFLLDEYVGLEPGHPESYRAFIEREFTSRVDLPEDKLHAPDVAKAGLETAGDRYEAAIAAAGGIDLQLLGIGSDGHIGFNEPSSSLGSRTRLKTLTAATRADNARFFGNDLGQVPRHVVTQGIGTILDARHLVLIANGADKSGPVAGAIEGPVTAMVPASALQLHPHATVVLDDAAAAELRLADYYRETFVGKPDWQSI
jgi:glucosamine-6-phosphate deaminase